MAFDAAGNLYVGDYNGGTICKSDAGWRVSTFVSGLSDLIALAFDTAGNLFVTSGGNVGKISKVTPSGTVSTFVNGLNNPLGLAFDDAGNLYVAHRQRPRGEDLQGHAGRGRVDVRRWIRLSVRSRFPRRQLVRHEPARHDGFMVTPSGVVSTYATGLPSPYALAFDTAGNLFVAQGDPNKISKVTPVATTGNVVEGNYIGVDATGMAPLGNTLDGVLITDGASGNTIGGTTAGARNIVSGNTGDGVQIIGSGTTANTVIGNYIGTNVAGNAAVGNSRRYRHQQCG